MSITRTSRHTLKSGRNIPVLGLGTWQLTENTADIVAAALEIGYDLVDTSGDYGTEPGVGEGAIKSGRKRESIFIQTKVEEDQDAYQSVLRSLDQLGLEYVDLILIHRPPKAGAGVDLWEGLIKARDEGLTREIGVSNYPKSLIEELIEATDEIPAVNQVEWSPFGHSSSLLDYARTRKILLQAYSPLTRTEKLKDGRLDELAEKYAKTPAQIMLRWDLQLGVLPIPKASSHKHLEENIDLFDFEIEREDMQILDSLNERYSALGKLPYE